MDVIKLVRRRDARKAGKQRVPSADGGAELEFEHKLTAPYSPPLAEMKAPLRILRVCGSDQRTQPTENGASERRTKRGGFEILAPVRWFRDDNNEDGKRSNVNKNDGMGRKPHAGRGTTAAGYPKVEGGDRPDDGVKSLGWRCELRVGSGLAHLRGVMGSLGLLGARDWGSGSRPRQRWRASGGWLGPGPGDWGTWGTWRGRGAEEVPLC